MGKMRKPSKPDDALLQQIFYPEKAILIYKEGDFGSLDKPVSAGI
jgi:hypothetical protein